MVLSNELLEAARGHGDAPFALIKAYLDAGGDVDDVASIVAQVRSDSGDASREEVAQTLRERLGQAGQDLSDEEVDRLVSQVTTGDG